jgi:F-type H+-transporting ATPase subunit delta
VQNITVDKYNLACYETFFLLNLIIKKLMKTFSETNRYAKAVYRLAHEAKSLDVLEKDFLKLKEILSQSDDLKKFIKNPTNKYSVINNVIDALTKHFSFSDLFSRFLKVLNKNRRFFFVEKIVNNFFDLLLNETGEVLVTLKLSHAITDSEKADIAKKLDDILKKKINISFSVDQSLLVGSILQIGSTMIDTSAKTRLNNLLNK